jgi:putative transcriptional regulator
MGLGDSFQRSPPEADAPSAKGHESVPWLTGKLLVAMPSMPDPRFARTVVFICSHGPEGAMGLIVNRLFGEINFRGLLAQLHIAPNVDTRDMPVHFGGPVDTVRGFVLHSASYRRQGTMPINEAVSLTATVEILEALARGDGPSHALLALGYAGWSPGQLEGELQANGWLVAPATDELLFMPNIDAKWDHALASIGVSPVMLSGDIGHA